MRYTKSKDGYYRTSVWDGTYKNGKKHYKQFAAKTNDALNKMVNNYKIALKTGDAVATTDTSVYEYAKLWKSLKKDNKAAATKDMYDNLINKHIKNLDMPISDLNHSTIQWFLNNYNDRPRTNQQLVMCLKQIIRMAIKDRLLPRDAISTLFEDISTPKYKSAEKRPLTDAEKAAIKDAEFTDREKAFIYTLYATGMRKEEALALTIFDLDFNKSEIRINKTCVFVNSGTVLQQFTKSDNGYRSIPMPDYLKDLLQEYVKTLSGSNLFTKLDGTTITKNSYRRMMESIRNKMKNAYITDCKKKNDNFKENLINWDIIGFEDLTAHIFRHNYCTMLCYEVLKGNISTKRIAALLGDTEAMVLKVYSHIVEEKEKPVDAIQSAVAL